MRRIHRFLCLPQAERRLVLEVALLLGAIRLGLTLLPFRTLRSLLARVAVPTAQAKGQTSGESYRDRVVWAVTVAGRSILKDRACLAQALALQLLFQRNGFPAHLCIGVAKGDNGQLQAHAWVESDGVVVIGGPDHALERFTPLPLEREGL